MIKHILLALILPLLCATVVAESMPFYQRPKQTALTDWGLREAPPFSTPIRLGGLDIEQNGYLLLGPKNSNKKQCVTLVQIVDSQRACQRFKCQGLLKWGGLQKPHNQQLAFLSQPCGSAEGNRSTLLFHNHTPAMAQEYWAESHIRALDLSWLEAKRKWGEAKVGPWEQIVRNGQYQIELDTFNSTGFLTWHPKRGFKWIEPNPSVHNPALN